MEKYKYGPYRICAPQIIYNSISPASIRKTLFDRLINLALPLNGDYTFILDERVFDGFSENARIKILKPFMNDLFSSKGLNAIKLEAICYWMSRGLIPLVYAKDIVAGIASGKDNVFVFRLSIGIIKTVFKHPEYESLRKVAVEKIFLALDHKTVAPRPFILGMVSAVLGIADEPEFVAALTECKMTERMIEIRAILDSEISRMKRVTKPGALYLADGIENVLETYNQAIIKLNSFEMTLNEKATVLNSVLINLEHLNTENGQLDFVETEFTAELTDKFVRVSVYLAVQIFLDATGPIYMVDLESDCIEILLGSLVEYVRDSNIQAFLVNEMFDAIKDRPSTRDGMVECLPKFMNWRRFLVDIDNIRRVLKRELHPEKFDKFLNEIVEAAFRFEEGSDAKDLARHPSQLKFIHEKFFAVMSELIRDFVLPVKFTVKILNLMIENSDRIDFLSPDVINFLRTAIKARNIDSFSTSFLINTYGGVRLYDDQQAVVLEVLKLLNKRPDIIQLALINGNRSDAHEFIFELETIAKDYVEYGQPSIQFINAIYNYPPASSVESLKLVGQVNLPEHVKRSLAAWLSTSKNISNELLAQIASISLNYVPSFFDVESFTSYDDSLQSWLPISVSLVPWISKISADFPQQFGSKIDNLGIENFMNILLWNLEYDGAEKVVFKAFLNFMKALNYASTSAQYHLIKLLGHSYIRPLTKILRSNYESDLEMCSILRLWSSAPSSKLAPEIEKLALALLDEEIKFTEDEIILERSAFLKELNNLDPDKDINTVLNSLSQFCKRIVNLRLTHEIDLIFSFIKQLALATRKFYRLDRSNETSELASKLGLTLQYLRPELLLHSDWTVFIDFFKFIYKHISIEKKIEYFAAADLLFTQIRSKEAVHFAFTFFIEDLRLETCLIPGSGLPKQFYQDECLITQFYQTYVAKLNYLGSQNAFRSNGINGVELDGTHFLMLFNVLHEMNASDELFKDLFENISRLHDNNLINDAFAENLKAFCIKRPHLVDDLIKIYINQPFVNKAFNQLVEPSKGNIMTVFKLMLKSNPKLFQERVATLPPNLQSLMNE